MHYKLKGTKRTPKIIGVIFLVTAVLLCPWIPFFIHYETTWCIIWPTGRLYQEYPHQVLVFNEYTWSAYYKICLYAFLVMFWMVILAWYSQAVLTCMFRFCWPWQNANATLTYRYLQSLENKLNRFRSWSLLTAACIFVTLCIHGKPYGFFNVINEILGLLQWLLGKHLQFMHEHKCIHKSTAVFPTKPAISSCR